MCLGSSQQDAVSVKEEHNKLPSVEAAFCLPQAPGWAAHPQLRLLLCRTGGPNGLLSSAFSLESSVMETRKIRFFFYQRNISLFLGLGDIL